MLVEFGAIAGVWMGVQKGIWGLDSYCLNWHELCVCSGTGILFCLGIKILVQGNILVSLRVKEHGDLMHGKPCSRVAEAAAYQAGGF